ncbi:MAG: tetratricopeptide repeat protein, partial [Candidatus Gastranaerophilaceae bacterium]
IHDYQAAISILKQLTTRNPKSLTMVQKLAGLYMEIRDLRSAKELYDKVILKNSPTASTLYQYAIISSQLYDTDTAERIFKKVIGMNPDNALAHKDLGVIYLNKRLFDYAEDEFNIALKLEPENYDIIFEYANFLYSITKYKEADEYYEKALSINNDVIAKTLRAMNKIELNELDKAKELIDSALEEEPHHEYIQFMAGRIYFALKEYEKAKIFLIHSIEQNPDIESKNLLALTYFGLEEYKSANNIFINLLSKNSDNISLLLNSAKCYDKLGENDKALEKLYKLTEIFPEHEEAQEMIRRLS